MTTTPFVAVIMGSDSDLEVMQGTLDVLTKFCLPFEVKISSAHRTPAATHDYVIDAQDRGCAVFIAAAGMAAHLAGTVAGLTTRPVIGVPIDAGPLQGMDSLLSTVQMPAGVPVATVAIGKAGAKNAGYLAGQIMALSDPSLATAVAREREENAASVLAKDAALQRKLSG